MTDLLALSSDIIDGKLSPDESGPMNRINFQLSPIADGIAMVEAFSHCILFETATATSPGSLTPPGR